MGICGAINHPPGTKWSQNSIFVTDLGCIRADMGYLETSWYHTVPGVKPMAVVIRDSDLEKQIEQEQERRNHGTAARTARDLLKERLIQLDIQKQEQRRTSPVAQVAG
jgi:hypothetical protein